MCDSRHNSNGIKRIFVSCHLQMHIFVSEIKSHVGPSEREGLRFSTGINEGASFFSSFVSVSLESGRNFFSIN